MTNAGASVWKTISNNMTIVGLAVAGVAGYAIYRATRPAATTPQMSPSDCATLLANLPQATKQGAATTASNVVSSGGDQNAVAQAVATYLRSANYPNAADCLAANPSLVGPLGQPGYT